MCSASADANYVSTYTINSANTWEYKTIAIPACTTGTWVITPGSADGGLFCRWSLGAGSGISTSTLNTWTSGNKTNLSGGTNWISNSGATFQLTGCQIELGTAASSFEYRPYGTELQLCQRYFEYGFTRSLTTTNSSGSYNPDHNWFSQFNVEKRGSPPFTRSKATDTQITFNGITPNVYGFTSEWDGTTNGQNSSQFNFSANSEL